jgi:cobalt-zinc-cadmium resistance protein CzcA
MPRGDQSFVVRGVGLVRNLDDLGNVVVTQTNGVPVLVRDVGTLSYAHQEPEGILGKNGNPATVEGILQLLKYANASEVLAGVHAKVEELRRQLEPQDVHIVPYIDRSDLIAATVGKIGHTLLEGVGLVDRERVMRDPQAPACSSPPAPAARLFHLGKRRRIGAKGCGPTHP